MQTTQPKIDVTGSSFGRAFSSGARKLESVIPKPQAMPAPAVPAAPAPQAQATSPAPSGRASWVTDSGADLRKYGTVTTPYGGSTKHANNPGSGESHHEGVDVAAGKGKMIPAFRSGTVTEVRSGIERGRPNSYGNTVIVTDPQGNRWQYSHVDRSWVKKGQPVKAGDYIAAEGNSGNTYSASGGDGSHLHLMILSAFGKSMDPKEFGIQY